MANEKKTCPFAANENGIWNCSENCALWIETENNYGIDIFEPRCAFVEIARALNSVSQGFINVNLESGCIDVNVN